jgi:hypothetical protein
MSETSISIGILSAHQEASLVRTILGVLHSRCKRTGVYSNGVSNVIEVRSQLVLINATRYDRLRPPFCCFLFSSEHFYRRINQDYVSPQKRTGSHQRFV